MKELHELDLVEKFQVYLDYLVVQLALKHFYFKSYLPYRDFETFCNETDDRVSSGLPGWYWRFKHRIF